MSEVHGNSSAAVQPLGQDALVQLRLAHLNMIQGIIGRVSGFSAAAKNFSVTLAAASVAVNLAEETRGLLWIALLAVALLGLMDAYYLAQEKAFRDLYDEIADRPLANASKLNITRHGLQFGRALKSLSVWGFYLPQLIVVGTMMGYN